MRMPPPTLQLPHSHDHTKDHKDDSKKIYPTNVPLLSYLSCLDRMSGQRQFFSDVQYMLNGRKFGQMLFQATLDH